jgi:hypothetical protein
MRRSTPGLWHAKLRRVSAREHLRRAHSRARSEHTAGEVALLYLGTAVGCLLAAVGLGLTIFGSGTLRAIGVGLLAALVILWAIPLSPILAARRRRRENKQDHAKTIG